jgi:1,4-dihydroxy-2-naphthoate octaprenyltransferase
MTATSSQPTKWQAWYLATRPRVFTASFVPMGLAAVIAIQDDVFKPIIFILSLLGVMCLQTAANLVNEYADFRRGADELKQAGQGMTIKNKVLSPNEVLAGAIATVIAGSLIGLFLLAQSGPYLWLIGVGGVLVAITYTAGPFPLAYNGLGEIAAGIFMGPMIVLGAYYVMQPNIDAQKGVQLSLLAFPVMFSVANILHANNIRDIDADRAVNKRTLAVRFGLPIARLEYRVLMFLAYLSQLILIAITWMPITTLLTIITIPEARRLVRIIDHETDPKILHMAQGRTAKLHGQIGFWMVLGWLIWLLINVIV